MRNILLQCFIYQSFVPGASFGFVFPIEPCVQPVHVGLAGQDCAIRSAHAQGNYRWLTSAKGPQNSLTALTQLHALISIVPPLFGLFRQCLV